MNYHFKNTIQKMIMILFCFFVLILLLPCLKTNASNDDPIWIEGENNVNPGEEIVLTVKVSVPEDDGMIGMEGCISYDHKVFDLVDKTVLKENWEITAYNESTGKFLFEPNDEALNDKKQYIKDGGVLKITLKAKEKTRLLNSTVEIKDAKIVKFANNQLKMVEIKNTPNLKIRVNGINVVLIVSLSIIAIIIILMFIIKKININNKKRKGV